MRTKSVPSADVNMRWLPFMPQAGNHVDYVNRVAVEAHGVTKVADKDSQALLYRAGVVEERL